MKPICKECKHYHVNAVQVRKNKWRYEHKCLHPEVQDPYRWNPGIRLLGESKGFDLKRKTSPRWCPMRKEHT